MEYNYSYIFVINFLGQPKKCQENSHMEISIVIVKIKKAFRSIFICFRKSSADPGQIVPQMPQ